MKKLFVYFYFFFPILSLADVLECQYVFNGSELPIKYRSNGVTGLKKTRDINPQDLSGIVNMKLVVTPGKNVIDGVEVGYSHVPPTYNLNLTERRDNKAVVRLPYGDLEKSIKQLNKYYGGSQTDFKFGESRSSSGSIYVVPSQGFDSNFVNDIFATKKNESFISGDHLVIRREIRASAGYRALELYFYFPLVSIPDLVSGEKIEGNLIINETGTINGGNFAIGSKGTIIVSRQ